jgi:hypothetical protein
LSKSNKEKRKNQWKKDTAQHRLLKKDYAVTKKKYDYVPIKNLSTSNQEKRQTYWRKDKAQQRLRTRLQAAKHLLALNKVDVHKTELAMALQNFDEASVFITRGELLGLQNAVVICRENVQSMQHLVICHQVAASHDVYGVQDSVFNIDNSANSSEGDGLCTNSNGSDLAMLEKRDGTNISGRSGGNNSGALKSWTTSHDQSNDTEDDDCIIVDEGSTSHEAANGKNRHSPIEICCNDDHHSFEDNRRLVLALDEQVQRYSHITAQHLLWDPDSVVHATTRADLLASSPNDPNIAEYRRIAASGDENVSLISLVTYKSMDWDVPTTRDQILTNVMRRNDLRRLLTLGKFVTDGIIYMYSALLMERDHALFLHNKARGRSWIFGPHFYTTLSPNRESFNYSDVCSIGKNKVPGNRNTVCHTFSICCCAAVHSLLIPPSQFYLFVFTRWRYICFRKAVDSNQPYAQPLFCDMRVHEEPHHSGVR